MANVAGVEGWRGGEAEGGPGWGSSTGCFHTFLTGSDMKCVCVRVNSDSESWVHLDFFRGGYRWLIFLKMIFLLLLFYRLLGCSSAFLPGFGQRPKEKLRVTSSEARPSSPGTPWRCLLMAGPTQPENQGSTRLTHSSQVNSSLTHTSVWEESGVPEETNLLPNTHTHTLGEYSQSLKKSPLVSWGFTPGNF